MTFIFTDMLINFQGIVSATKSNFTSLRLQLQLFTLRSSDPSEPEFKEFEPRLKYDWFT